MELALLLSVVQGWLVLHGSPGRRACIVVVYLGK